MRAKPNDRTHVTLRTKLYVPFHKHNGSASGFLCDSFKAGRTSKSGGNNFHAHNGDAKTVYVQEYNSASDIVIMPENLCTLAMAL